MPRLKGGRSQTPHDGEGGRCIHGVGEGGRTHPTSDWHSVAWNEEERGGSLTYPSCSSTGGGWAELRGLSLSNSQSNTAPGAGGMGCAEAHPRSDCFFGLLYLDRGACRVSETERAHKQAGRRERI